MRPPYITPFIIDKNFVIFVFIIAILLILIYTIDFIFFEIPQQIVDNCNTNSTYNNTYCKDLY